MAERTPKVPSYRLHKATGQAIVTLSGHDVYLGPHNTPESRAKYESVIAEWLAAGRVLRPEAGALITLDELVDAYWAHARAYYLKDGNPTKQQERVRRSLDVVLELYSGARAVEFGPLRLKAVRQRMIERRWVRRHINQCIGCVKLAFKWAVSEELIPPSVFEGLRTVAGLEAGRGHGAKEGAAEVLPAPEAAVRAVQAVVTPQIRDLIEFQLWTGARPGEAVGVRPCDLDADGKVELGFGPIDLGKDVWVYRPRSHKTAHHGHRRIILLGPQAQAVLRPYLEGRSVDSNCFSPAEAQAWRFAWQREQRQTPVQPSQARRAEQARRLAPRRTKLPGTHYTVSSYGHAIEYGIEKAKCEHWHAHQLRHNASTRLVAAFGWEVARIILGHRSVEMTRQYAVDDLHKAAEAVRKAG